MTIQMSRYVLGVRLGRSIGGWYCTIGGQRFRFTRAPAGSWQTFQLPGKERTNTILLRSTRTIADAVKILRSERYCDVCESRLAQDERCPRCDAIEVRS